jgi:peptidoglycan-N-acetylglucosamine deacetylase
LRTITLELQTSDAPGEVGAVAAAGYRGSYPLVRVARAAYRGVVATFVTDGEPSTGPRHHRGTAMQVSPRVVVSGILMLALTVLGAGVALALAAISEVEITVDGQRLQVRTTAGTVAGVLDQFEVALHEADLVAPPLGTPVEDGLVITIDRAVEVEVRVDGAVDRLPIAPTATVDVVLDHLGVELATPDVVSPDAGTLVADGQVIIVDRAITVAVEVDGGEARRITAVLATVGDVLDAAGMTDLLDGVARIHPPPTRPVQHGDVVRVRFPVPVTVVADGGEVTVATFGRDVAAALRDAHVTLGDDDLVAPGVHSALVGPSRVVVRRVVFVDDTEELALPHDVIRRETDELPDGETRVDREGRDGLRIDRWRVTLIDGEEVERELVERRVEREPTDRVVLSGTYVAPPPPPSLPPSPAAPGGGSSTAGGPDAAGPAGRGGTAGSGPPSGASGDKVIHLTYDDGPDSGTTPRILDLLARYNARATFFAVGRLVPDNRALAQRIVNEGHRIGNHSWSHPSLAGVSRDVFDAQLRQTQQAIEAATGRRPTCLRPPYGATDGNTRARAADHGLRVKLWDIDTNDWRRPGGDVIAQRVVDNARPGAIVLMHDGGASREQTVAATERVLSQLSAQGYSFAPVPGC